MDCGIVLSYDKMIQNTSLRLQPCRRPRHRQNNKIYDRDGHIMKRGVSDTASNGRNCTNRVYEVALEAKSFGMSPFIGVDADWLGN